MRQGFNPARPYWYHAGKHRWIACTMATEESREIFYVNLASIPAGRYCSYGDMASLCGVHVRQVLAWLRQLPADSGLPWYRLVNGQRRIADYAGRQHQFRLLADEGLLPEVNGRYPRRLRWPDEAATTWNEGT